MRYNITTNKAPEMPNLGKGTECIKLLLSQASKDMHEPLVPMLFPSLGAHISGADFQYPDLIWRVFCGQMASLVEESGGKKNVKHAERLRQTRRKFKSKSKRECVKHQPPRSPQEGEEGKSPLPSPSETSGSYKIFRKRVIIPVFIRSANMAPTMGTMRNGLTA